MKTPQIPSYIGFKDPRQQRIYRRLQLIGPGPASFYRDATFIMDGDLPFSATSHIVSHLLREIESSLRNVLEPLAGQRSPASSPDVHETSIKIVLQALEIPQDEPAAKAWLRLTGKDNPYGLSRRAHRRALDRPRPLDQEFREFYDDFEMVLDIVLERFEGQYLTTHQAIDALLEKEYPTSNDIKKLRNSIPNNQVSLGYFFDALDYESWLEPLAEGGFFTSPPEYEIDQEGNIRDVSWPQSRYLVRMTPRSPDIVHSIALGIPSTANFHIQEDLTEVALTLPSALASDFLPMEMEWLKSQYKPFTPEKRIALLVHFIKGGEIDAGFQLGAALLAVREDPQILDENNDLPAYSSDIDTVFFDTQHYQRALNKIVAVFQEADIGRTLVLLCDLLNEAMELSTPKNGIDGSFDASYRWRPVIEDERGSSWRRILSILTSAVRDVAEQAMDDGHLSIRFVIELLEGYPWQIFHRLALHELRLHAQLAREMVSDRLKGNMALLDELGIRLEYALLLQSQFRFLEPQDQTEILELIEAGPDIGEFTTAFERQQGSLPSPEDLAEHAGNWRRDRLALIIDEAPRMIASQYHELVDDFGQARSFTEPMIGPVITEWVSRKSPKSADELSELSVDEVIDFLDNWRPPNRLMGPSREGLRNEFTSFVAGNVDQFAATTDRLKSLSMGDINAFLFGIRKALEQERAIDWAHFLPFFRWIVEQPPEGGDQHLELDSTTRQTRQTVAEILSAGLSSDDTRGIAINLRTNVWEILLFLTRDSEPTPDYEARYGGQNMDPSTLSINTVRGRSMHSVIHYALWVRRHSQITSSEPDNSADWFSIMPEVQRILNEHLILDNDPSLAVRSVFGQRFPALVSLDSKWAKENASVIFPQEESSREYQYAAWNAYLSFNPAYEDTFQILFAQYLRAIEDLDLDPIPEPILAPWSSHSQGERLATHLIPLYWSGKIEMDKTDDLLVRFFDNAPDKLRGFTIGYIGRALHNAEDEIPFLVLTRLQNLFEKRLDVAHTGESAPFDAELAAFGWWFIGRRFGKMWSLSRLQDVLTATGRIDQVHRVLEQLATMSNENPVPTVRCLEFIIEGEFERWRIQSWKEHIRTILENAVERGNEESRTLAISVINRLGARGNLDFKDLLPIV